MLYIGTMSYSMADVAHFHNDHQKSNNLFSSTPGRMMRLDLYLEHL
jgi:hypothetical protein